MNSYDYWTQKKNYLNEKIECTPYRQYTEEILEIYNRHLTIVEDILLDCENELNDDQYCETASWHYENELKILEDKEALLEPQIQERIIQQKHQDLLNDLCMTQEQYSQYLLELEDLRIKNKKSKLKN